MSIHRDSMEPIVTSNHLHAALVRRGISQADIARRLDLDRRTVNHVVRGRGRSRRVEELIAELIGRSATAMFPVRPSRN